MAYADYTLKMALQTFGLTEEPDFDLFADVVPLEPSDVLRDWLDQCAPLAVGMNTEKARSEYIIVPILVAVMRQVGSSLIVHSGVMFDVDRAQGLTGFCDFLIARSRKYYYVQGPVLAVVEAKKEDLTAGLGQCAAEMVAIRLYNEREGTPVPAVYGCVTSGTNWRFLKLVGPILAIDRTEYYLHDLAKILGILVHIARG